MAFSSIPRVIVGEEHITSASRNSRSAPRHFPRTGQSSLSSRDRTFGFVLGDVAGKGPPAALLAAKIQGILAAFSTVAQRPADVLNRANEEVLRRTVESRFATILYGHLAPDGSLTYCNAGHNPPLVIGKRGLRRLEAGGVILGAFDSVRFEQETVMLDPGDVLIAFSDGVTEALNREGVEFGEERLVSSITTLQSPKVLLERVLASVRDFTNGTDPSDDVTCSCCATRGPALGRAKSWCSRRSPARLRRKAWLIWKMPCRSSSAATTLATGDCESSTSS
jgi:hypothetical protein